MQLSGRNRCQVKPSPDELIQKLLLIQQILIELSILNVEDCLPRNTLVLMLILNCGFFFSSYS